jgi:hypothetical protein
MEYKITSYTYNKLDKLNKQLRENITIKPSKRGYHKIDVYNGGTYLFSIGDKRYLSYPEYLKTGKVHADKRKELYYKRHPIYPKYTRGWFSSYLLW